jgi:predicted dehydrogenase
LQAYTASVYSKFARNAAAHVKAFCRAVKKLAFFHKIIYTDWRYARKKLCERSGYSMGKAEKVTREIRIGIIGCGGIANGKHLPALKNVKDVRIVAFCDILPEKAEAAKKKFGQEDANVYEDYKELLKDESIDVVHVLTPNRAHSFITVDALRAGKHVLCEKPMAINYAEAKKMLAAAQETGKILSIGYQNRWTPKVQYAKEVAEAGELGEIYYARAVALRRRAVPTWGVFLNEKEQGGGPLIDIGTHALDITLWLMNNYKPKYAVGATFRKLADQKNQANAWGDWDPKEFTTEDAAFGFVVMENGAVVSVETAWALNIADPKEAVTQLCGTLGGLDMLGKAPLTINAVRHGRQIIETPSFDAGGVAFFDGATKGDPADLEALAFYDAVRGGKPTPTRPEQALVVTWILEAIYTSAKTGKQVFYEG